MYAFKKDCVAMRYNLFFLNQDLLINGGSRIVLNDEDAIIAHLFLYRKLHFQVSKHQCLFRILFLNYAEACKWC